VTAGPRIADSTSLRCGVSRALFRGMRIKDRYGWLRPGIRCARIPSLAAILADESGQDLIEYALVVALIALAATVSMSSVATAIGTAFTNITGHLATYTT
jgi:pilus assembly protein Flp/PilA